MKSKERFTVWPPEFLLHLCRGLNTPWPSWNLTSAVLVLMMQAFLASCSTNGLIQREQLVSNLAPVLQIEEQARNLAQEQQMLRFSGWLGEEGNRQFKNHYDVYYVYHAAAISHLSQGAIPLYIECVHLAQSELDAMKKILDRSREKGTPEFRPFRMPRPMPKPRPEEGPGSGDPT